MNTYRAYYKSPIGIIEIEGNEEGVTSLEFMDEYLNNLQQSNKIPDCMKESIVQLDEYFAGKRKKFTTKIVIDGTEFQKKVWNELIKVPYGTTATYKDIAAAVGNIKAVRAVGNTNRNNKIAIIIPCHRIIGSDGSLTGYAGGLHRKEWLIKHEQKYK